MRILHLLCCIKYMNLINELGKFFLSLTTHPSSPTESLGYQEDFLLNLVEKNQNTIYGKKYNFANIQSIQDFQKQVPITQYNDYKDYIDQSMKGEKDILIKGKVDRFAKTAWTTAGESKYIPVTKEALKKNHYAWGQEALARYCKTYNKTQVFDGKSIMIGGGFFPNPYTQEENIGYISAILQKNAPAITKRTRAIDEDTVFLHDRDEKLYKMVQSTKNQNITNIGWLPSRVLVFLQELCNHTHKKTIKEIRPNLELFFSGGINIAPYRTQFAELFGWDVHIRQIYNASEWFIAVQSDKEGNDMLLLTQHGIFFEFIDMETFDTPNPTIHTLEQVQTNKNYAIVITTTTGLYRYIIGDTVKFTTTQPYKIQITGRTKTYLAVFGENLIVDQADLAIYNACEKLGCSITDYTVAPLFFEWGHKGAHERYIEFNKAPQDLRVFANTLDAELQKANNFYAGKRFKNMIMDIPIIQSLPKGTFHKRLKSKDKLGHQNKIPRLSNTRDFAEELQQYSK